MFIVNYYQLLTSHFTFHKSSVNANRKELLEIASDRHDDPIVTAYKYGDFQLCLTQSQLDADKRENAPYNPEVDKGKKIVVSRQKKESILISDSEEEERPKRRNPEVDK